MELKDIQKVVQDETQPLAAQVEAAKNSADKEIKKLEENIKELEEKLKKPGVVDPEITKTLNELNTSLKSVQDWKVTKDEADKLNQEALDKLIADKKTINIPDNGKAKSFNEILAEAITKNAEEIKNFKKGNPELKIDLLPEVKSERGKSREVKAVGDMSITANFPGAVSLYQQVGSLIQSTYNRVWLSDLLPYTTSNATSILYPKENGGEGAAELWTDRTQDKAQMDYDLTTESAYFKWIAGFVIVDRDMLDDIAFLLSYIQSKMLISLKTAENAFILNGSADTNPVTGLLDAATAYSGTFTATIDRIVDAAYGQIVEDTDQFYQGSTVILRPRDAVKIGLNQATGSGEYDLPPGSAAFATGKLALAGLETPVTTSIAANTFLALDKAATMFVRRMAPELRVFEDSVLAKRNKLMFRIEERATLAIFNNAAIVTGELDGAGS